MLHDQIIGLSAVKDGRQICEPLFAEAGVHCVHDSDLLVHNDIGVVCHSVGYDILSLEQIDLMIVNAYVFDVVCYFHLSFSYRQFLFSILLSEVPKFMVSF